MIGRGVISISPFLGLTLAAAFVTSASADWPPGGKLVSSPGDINGVRNARIMELPSGDLVIVGVGSAGSTNTYNVQRLTRDGQVAPGMPIHGIPWSSVIKGANFRTHSVVVDDASRAWHTWAWSNSMLESVGDDGVRVPTSSAYNLGSSGGGPMHAAPAPGGQAFVTIGSARLKRIDPSGAPAGGWPAAGFGLPTESYQDNALLPDGSGGVVVFLRSGAGGFPPMALRFDGNGASHAGWPIGGLLLSGVSPGSDIGPLDSQLILGGPGSMIAVWSLDAGSGTRRLMMQRFGLDGTVDPAWPEDGIEAVAPETLYACRAIPDGLGGAYVVRQAQMRPVATHISAAGTLLGSASTNLLDAGAQYVPTLFGGTATVNIPDDIIADVTDDGGLLVGWNDTRLAPTVSFRLRWMTPALAPAPDKPAEPLVFYPESPHPYAGALLALNADGPSGAFIAWGDYHDIGFSQVSGDLWMTYVQGPTTVGVQPTARALSLSAPRPNPAIGSAALDLVLPDDAPARVELLDVAGRVLRMQLVEGAGSHAITFDALASLAPGLYFARATSRDRSTTMRVVVSR
jgi:hypothetical protein